MKEFWTSLASLMGVWAFCQSLLHAVIPPELRFASLKFCQRLFNWCSTYCYYDITEIDGVNTNELYNAAQLYLSTTAAAAVTGSRLSLTRAVNSSAVTFGLANNDRLVDVFRRVPVVWEHVVTQRQSQTFSWRPLPEEKRGFTIRIKKQDKALILDSYLDHIMYKASEIRRKNQDRFLYTNSRGGSLDSRGHPWESVPFKHPSTFDTLAMDPIRKQAIKDDLDDFATGQAFYQTAGRSWKRGYLLYGPPGTGKSSMIAAMANHLGYDIYDLELTEPPRDGFSAGDEKWGAEEGGNSITLSGLLLNFTDGLWSCCGSERIFVFTTNHVEKLDPALLRSGRMDMHIFMSYCSFPALLILLKNYLGFGEGDLDEAVVRELGEVIDEAEMTPADVSEVLIKNRRDRDKAVGELLGELKARAGKKRESLGLMRDRNEVAEEEEQEREALESPKQGFDELQESCEKGEGEA
ncbi:P-loop containing nucleoside triphosphate hydrolases superfamily protein [Actinidia rufa]|uniref:P-loop containing nucleoside triphosphate hydrolases superfamily protein n=1 Tax=Actinidia rufa TaxID=165716 RepID=A0A7J0EXL6_9ERIC|nr:P-loop containing nucleoside triphosphate hydrolases superfamily protein [Actinidia rufa]